MPIRSCGCDEDTKKFAMQYFRTNQILINEECDMQRFFFICWKNLKFILLKSFLFTQNEQEDDHLQAKIQGKLIFIDEQLSHEEFQVCYKGEVDPLTISKVVDTNFLGKIVEYVDAYVGTKHQVVIKM